MLPREQRTKLNKLFREKKALSDNVHHNVREYNNLEAGRNKEFNLLDKEDRQEILRTITRKINDQKQKLKEMSALELSRIMKMPRQNITYYEKIFNRATNGVVLS